MSEIPEQLHSALPERYQLQRVLGRGGMATVYLAEDLKHGRKVAVKVLHPDLAASIAAERFLREIGFAAQLTHPHILMLIDSGEAGGFLYYVMPFVEGSLRGLLDREGRLEADRALEMTREVADALDYAHRQGILHRDIKPENILLAEGHAVVADFGVAKAISTAGGENVTRTGFPVGTLGYMSPEQAAGRSDLDERTDIYSLASVFYEAVTGEPPGMWLTDEAGRLGRFIKAPPHHREVLDRLPGFVEATLVRAMRLEPEHRFQTAGEFARALADAFSGRRRYSEEEAHEIVKHAAELEARPTQDGALSLGGIQQIAAEAGIPPAHVHEAARALDKPATGIVRGGYYGVTGKVEMEEVVTARVSPREYAPILEDIRRTFGQSGQIKETFDQSLFWESRPGPLRGRAQITLSPRGGQTTIRITEYPGEEIALSVLFGIGGLGLGAAAVAIAQSLGIELWFGGLIGAATWGWSYAAYRTWYQSRIKKRFGVLSGLLERVAKYIAGDK
jgi:tRNA A-37 threonylcarbamoyl transferase component Bud32